MILAKCGDLQFTVPRNAFQLENTSSGFPDRVKDVLYAELSAAAQGGKITGARQEHQVELELARGFRVFANRVPIERHGPERLSQMLADPDFLVEVSFVGRILGGKGGLAATLREEARKKDLSGITNFEACRDLQGRRLRNVHTEQMIAKHLRDKKLGKNKAATQKDTKKAKAKQKKTASAASTLRASKRGTESLIDRLKTEDLTQSAIEAGVAIEAKKASAPNTKKPMPSTAAVADLTLSVPSSNTIQSRKSPEGTKNITRDPFKSFFHGDSQSDTGSGSGTD